MTDASISLSSQLSFFLLYLGLSYVSLGERPSKKKEKEKAVSVTRGHRKAVNLRIEAVADARVRVHWSQPTNEWTRTRPQFLLFLFLLARIPLSLGWPA